MVILESSLRRREISAFIFEHGWNVSFLSFPFLLDSFQREIFDFETVTVLFCFNENLGTRSLWTRRKTFFNGQRWWKLYTIFWLVKLILHFFGILHFFRVYENDWNEMSYCYDVSAYCYDVSAYCYDVSAYCYDVSAYCITFAQGPTYLKLMY